MSLIQLDYFFPFFVFLYGVLVVFVIENQKLKDLAQRRHPDWHQRLSSHRVLGYVSFFVGGLWSLQNLLV